MNQSPLLVAQVTDVHLFADQNQELLGLSTRRSFKVVLEQLLSLQPQPDLLLLTGDLSQDGTFESYVQLQNLLAPLSLPVYWLPGNHDCLNLMQQLLRAPLSPCKSFEQGGWQFILLDSAIPEQVYGYLSLETLDALKLQLEIASHLPALIAIHHPPCKINSDWMDAIMLQNREELFAIIDRHPQVKLVIFGHIHQEFSWQRQGVHYLGTPASSIQFKPQSSIFSLGQEKPGFRLLNLYPDGSWETRIERVTYAEQLDLTATGY